ncbi:unnamed protein product [Hermetia illucens]|uniref:Uncharacterized protein n=1 Tax=Hermetia illucens TaxID=343691 RepID=A0A7R8UMP7_HERIL|nr:dentin sialophosphoprotein isoform X2 [Hermetia illucens]CAD7083334.1 unnamed protein product [Hermetia illucens]
MKSSTNSRKASMKQEKVQIKTEKDELHPLAHYVDDRVELVKQIFSCLKTKTIRNLAPGFLKDSPIDEIKELCLNELLGLSTKRLLSIINSTKCPTDTESSSDSDVHNVEEHISLEEISSDSETEKSHGASKPKKAKKDQITKEQQQNDNAKDKGVSVLELLELQARARAIRSQLALEPVAKIEVDSDDSTDDASQSTSKVSSSSRSNDKKMTNGAEPSAVRKTKSVKLKRNFRKANHDEDTEDVENKKSEKDVGTEKSENSKVESEKKDRVEDGGGAKQERSASPDVITILPSPETLCISDSSDENDDVSYQSSLREDARTERIEKEADDRQKQSSSNDVSSQKEPIGAEVDNLKQSEAKEKEQEEIEDGEIIDNDGSIAATSICDTTAEEAKSQPTANAETEALAIKKEMLQSEDIAPIEDNARKDFSKVETPEGSKETEQSGSVGTDSSKEGTDQLDKVLQDHKDDDSIHQCDDVISLGNDDLEDLHDEQDRSKDEASNKPSMPTHSHEEDQKPSEIASEQIDNDVITLDNSSDEESTLSKFSESNQVAKK